MGKSYSADRQDHQCDTDRVRFFNPQIFGYKERLSDLVLDDPRDPKAKQKQDGIHEEVSKS
jgi:hypothetical protein